MQILPSLLLVSLTSSSPKSSAGPSRAVGALERGIPYRPRSCLQFVRYLGGRCNAAAGAGHEPGHYHWAVNVAGTQAKSPSVPCVPGWAGAGACNLPHAYAHAHAHARAHAHAHAHAHSGSAEHHCQLLSGHLLLFVGDSIQEEFYFTFCAAMWAHYPTSQRESCNPSPHARCPVQTSKAPSARATLSVQHDGLFGIRLGDPVPVG